MLGDRIQSLAKRKRISVSEIADRMNVTVQHVYKLFKKDSMETRYLFQFAEILDVSPDVLLMGADGGDFSTRAVSELQKEIAQLKKRIAELEDQLADKTQILDYAKQENLFAYANLIQALLSNRTGKDGGIDPEQLTGLTRSRIFDDVFLRKLLDQGLISDADYLYFSQQAKEKK
jgi:transcriptional regulator with XRE-family HTH domain